MSYSMPYGVVWSNHMYPDGHYGEDQEAEAVGGFGAETCQLPVTM
jgi:hypothetical protein